MKSKTKIKVMSLNILDLDEFLKSINEYKKIYNLLAVVTTTDVQLADIPCFTALDILGGSGLQMLNAIIDREEQYEQIADSLEDHLIHVNGPVIVEEVRTFIGRTIESMQLNIENGVQVGILLHTCFLVDKLLQGLETKSFPDVSAYMSLHRKSFLIVENNLSDICKKYQVQPSSDDLAFLSQMFVSNDNL